MQVNLPRGISAPDALTAATSMMANKNVESKDVQDAITVLTEVATQKRQEALEALEDGETSKKELDELDKKAIKSTPERTPSVIDMVMPSLDLKYTIVDDTNSVQVQVVKKDDGAVIRKIPDDKIIQIVKILHELFNLGNLTELDVKG